MAVAETQHHEHVDDRRMVAEHGFMNREFSLLTLLYLMHLYWNHQKCNPECLKEYESVKCIYEDIVSRFIPIDQQYLWDLNYNNAQHYVKHFLLEKKGIETHRSSLLRKIPLDEWWEEFQELKSQSSWIDDGWFTMYFHPLQLLLPDIQV